MTTIQVSLAGPMGPPGPPAVPVAVATEDRPSPAELSPGASIFDTDLNKPIWVNAAGDGWVDATGAVVL